MANFWAISCPRRLCRLGQNCGVTMTLDPRLCRLLYASQELQERLMYTINRSCPFVWRYMLWELNFSLQLTSILISIIWSLRVHVLPSSAGVLATCKSYHIMLWKASKLCSAVQLHTVSLSGLSSNIYWRSSSLESPWMDSFIWEVFGLHEYPSCKKHYPVSLMRLYLDHATT